MYSIGNMCSNFLLINVIQRMNMTLPVRRGDVVVTKPPNLSDLSKGLFLVHALCLLWAIYSPALCHVDAATQADEQPVSGTLPVAGTVGGEKRVTTCL